MVHRANVYRLSTCLEAIEMHHTSGQGRFGRCLWRAIWPGRGIYKQKAGLAAEISGQNPRRLKIRAADTDLRHVETNRIHSKPWTS